MTGFEEIGQNDRFGAKMDIFRDFWVSPNISLGLGSKIVTTMTPTGSNYQYLS